MKTRPFKSLAVASAAAAAALPMAEAAHAQSSDAPKADVAKNAFAAAWTPHWYFSAEGGALWADYSRTSFPDGAPGKLGSGFATINSDSLSPRHNRGWFGALSIGRDIDPIWDWRLTGSFNSFDTNRRSASANFFFDTGTSSGGASNRVTESDRFRFGTVDFDMGHKWQQGLLQARAFAGLRGLGTSQNLEISSSERVGSADKLGSEEITLSTQTNGKSHFYGLGPRVGIEGFYGTTFGIVGSASAALIPGWRSSSLDRTQKFSDSGFFCDGEGSCIPFGDSVSSTSDKHRTKFTAVGYIGGSLGLGWRPTPTTMFEVGYRVDLWANIRETFDFADGAVSGQKKDVIIGAPFVKAVIQF